MLNCHCEHVVKPKHCSIHKPYEPLAWPESPFPAHSRTSILQCSLCACRVLSDSTVFMIEINNLARTEGTNVSKQIYPHGGWKQFDALIHKQPTVDNFPCTLLLLKKFLIFFFFFKAFSAANVTTIANESNCAAQGPLSTWGSRARSEQRLWIHGSLNFL